MATGPPPPRQIRASSSGQPEKRFSVATALLGTKNGSRSCRLDYMVEIRGFEPLTS